MKHFCIAVNAFELAFIISKLTRRLHLALYLSVATLQSNIFVAINYSSKSLVSAYPVEMYFFLDFSKLFTEICLLEAQSHQSVLSFKGGVESFF